MWEGFGVKRKIASLHQFPVYTRAERVADAAVHACGITIAIVGALLILVFGLRDASTCQIVGLPLYAGGLVAMLSCSALYNLAQRRARKEIFRRLDRAAIFLMIAGTYAPLTLCTIGGDWGIGLFVGQWCLAALGFVLVFGFPRRFEWVLLLLYLLMGWSILLALGPLIHGTDQRALMLLLAGGLIYTGGVGIYSAKRMPFHNALWHLCVLAAATTHYFAILDAVVIKS